MTVCRYTDLTYFLFFLWRIGPWTTPLHPVLSFATRLAWVASAQFFKLSLSLSTVLLQVSFGLPLLRFPSAVQVNAALTCLILSIRSTCPIHLHRLLLMVVLISPFQLFPLLSHSGLFVASRPLRFFSNTICEKASNICSSPFVIFHVFIYRLYSKTEITLEVRMEVKYHILYPFSQSQSLNRDSLGTVLLCRERWRSPAVQINKLCPLHKKTTY